MNRARLSFRYLIDSTKSFKNTDVVINEMILNILERVEGQKIGIFLFDCGPLNHNAALAMALMQFFVDIGLFTCSVALFLQLHHSKQLADTFFGLIEDLFGKKRILSIDALMYFIEQITCALLLFLCCCSSY